MVDADDSADPLTQIAAILAAGVQRLQQRRLLAPPESDSQGLEVCAETRLSVDRGLRTRESTESTKWR